MANIRHLVSIKAPAAKIYEAISTKEGLQKWWTDKVTGEAGVGQTLEFHFGPDYHQDMKVTKLDPNREVKWESTDGHPEWVGTTVDFAIEDKGDKSTLRFAHDGWKNQTDLLAECTYHWGRFMTSLKNVAEGNAGEPTKN
jgi:uncharacterized protein YndB with AHSA1/START domain